MSSIPADVVVYKRAPTLKEVNAILRESATLWKNTRHHVFASIDLEFTRGEFALIQICFDTGRGTDRKRTVYLSNHVFPGMVELFISPELVKIVHRGESNDIPWMLSQIPAHSRAELFVNLVDTGFIAEYINPDLKPGLYDVLVRFGAITNDHVLELLRVEKSMGRVQHVDWRLDRIKPAALEYAIHDVLHLRAVYSEARRRDSTIPQFRNIIRVCFLERFLKVLDKPDVDKVSNYYLNRNRMSLGDIATRIIGKLTVADLDFSRIMRIGYLRPPTQTLLKRIIYGILVHRMQVMVDKSTQYETVMQPIPDLSIRWSSLDHLIVEIRRAVSHILDQKRIGDN
jgi:hypothetical protein